MIRFTALVLAVALSAAIPAAAQTATSHGIAMHGDLKYPAGFRNFDYVNPDAPKGGEVRRSARGGFDTFNPYVIKGRSAAGVGFLYQTLMVSLSLIHISEPTRPY